MSGRKLLLFSKRLFSISENPALINSVELSGLVTRVYKNTSVQNQDFYAVHFKTICESRPVYLSCLVFNSDQHSKCEDLRINDFIRIKGDLKSNFRRAPSAVSVVANSIIVETR